ncbi:MAG: superoxide dismutase, partial [Mesorhizobium sp.]
MAWAQGGGSGWVLLTYSSRDRKLVNAWAADHTTTIAGGVPNLAFDMYKHTYHIDFGAKALGLRPPYRSSSCAAADSLPWFAA